MTDTPMQEPNDLIPPPDGGAEAGDVKPKRTRRAKAPEADAAPAEAAAQASGDEAPVARKTPRRRTAKVVEDTAVDAPALEAAPEQLAASADEAAPAKPKRAPRRKAAAPEQGDLLADSVDAPVEAADDAPVVREAAGDGFLQLGPVEASSEAGRDAVDVPEGAAGEPREGQDRPRRDRHDRQERRERRETRHADSGAERADRADRADGEGDAPSEEEARPSRRAHIAAEQATAVFAGVLTGDFDKVHEEEVEAEDAGDESAQTKRVLRPEPDAPKLQKVLAQSGVGSRRDIEQMIEDGRISVNGEVAHIGQRVSFGDKIAVGGKQIRVRISPPPARILAYHKPVGEVVTHDDPQDRPTVFRRLPRLQHGKWQSVGRLDLNTEGLLLFTNSGDLANQLMHPRFGVEREYAVRVLGTLTPDNKAKLLEGVDIEGQAASFKSIEEGGGEGLNRWYRVVITEGRNREVRKLFDAVGLTVSRLIRVRYGSIVLPHGLKRGVWAELGESDVRAVKYLAGGDRQDQGHGGQQGQGRRNDRNDRNDRDDRQNRNGNNNQRGDNQRGGQQQGKFGKDKFGQNNGQNQQRGQGPRGNGGNGGHGNNQGNRGPDRQQQARPPRDDRPMDRRPDGDDDHDHIGPIPNPLEQTFDRRFAKGSKRITSGFGRPDQNDQGQRGGGKKGGGPREPDPLQTSVGYIGADAFFGNKGGGGGGNRGGGGRRR